MINKWFCFLNIVLFWYFLYLNTLFINENYYINHENQKKENNFEILALSLLLTIIELCGINLIIVFIYQTLLNLYDHVKMRWRQYKKDRGKFKEIELREIVTCCICLNEIKKGIKLTCNHFLHKDCLNEMIDYNLKKCPLCCQEII